MKMVDLKWSNESSTSDKISTYYSESTTPLPRPEKYTLNGNSIYISGDDIVGTFDYGYWGMKKLTRVDRIIFNPPATIVIWKDGHKEVVKCSDDELFEPEVGVAMCFMKRIFGSRHRFTKLVYECLDEEAEDKLDGYYGRIKRKHKVRKNYK